MERRGLPDEHREIVGRVERYYSARLREHGLNPAGVDWRSRESQFLRFDQLMRVASDAETLRVNDYGCGYGALLDWLREDGRPFSYVGYDVSEAMIAAAADLRRPGERVRFTTELETLDPTDFTIASGIFNVKAGAGEGEWKAYVREQIDFLGWLSRRGFAFNALTSHSDPERMEPRLHYADPAELLAYVMRAHSRWAALLHDYGLYEFTVNVRYERLAG